MRTALRTATTAAGTVAAALVLAAVTAGTASAQPAPPAEPPRSPADQAAQFACLQKYMDFANLTGDALTDPIGFSATAAQAAQACDKVRAPGSPAPVTPPAS